MLTSLPRVDRRFGAIHKHLERSSWSKVDPWIAIYSLRRFMDQPYTCNTLKNQSDRLVNQFVRPCEARTYTSLVCFLYFFFDIRTYRSRSAERTPVVLCPRRGPYLNSSKSTEITPPLPFLHGAKCPKFDPNFDTSHVQSAAISN